MDLYCQGKTIFLEVPTLQIKITFFCMCDFGHCRRFAYLHAFLWQNTLPKMCNLFLISFYFIIFIFHLDLTFNIILNSGVQHSG